MQRKQDGALTTSGFGGRHLDSVLVDVGRCFISIAELFRRHELHYHIYADDKQIYDHVCVSAIDVSLQCLVSGHKPPGHNPT